MHSLISTTTVVGKYVFFQMIFPFFLSVCHPLPPLSLPTSILLTPKINAPGQYYRLRKEILLMPEILPAFKTYIFFHPNLFIQEL